MMHPKRRARVAAVAQRRDMTVAWWALITLALAAAAAPSWGQTGSATPTPDPTLPEVVRPRSDTPTLPPGNDGRTTAQPRSENPQVEGNVRPVPDSGVIAPPVSGMGTTPVIRPPATGTMPVIPPPGAAGGEKGVVPK
jgi:hypothetical protein